MNRSVARIVIGLVLLLSLVTGLSEAKHRRRCGRNLIHDIYRSCRMKRSIPDYEDEQTTTTTSRPDTFAGVILSASEALIHIRKRRSLAELMERCCRHGCRLQELSRWC